MSSARTANGSRYDEEGRAALGIIPSDLVYPNSLVPIKMGSDRETCELLNYCKYKNIAVKTRSDSHARKSLAPVVSEKCPR